MVEHMEKRQMAEFLLENKKEGVKHVNELGDIEDPGHRQGSHSFWILWVVNRLTCPAVWARNVEPAEVGMNIVVIADICGGGCLLPTLAEPPQTEQGLEDIVANNDPTQAVGGTLFHKPGNKELYLYGAK